MKTRTPPFHRPAPCLCRFLASILVLAAVPVSAQEPPEPLPGGLWQIIEDPAFPERYSPPTAFTALMLDRALLEAFLDGVPRESFGRIPPDPVMPLPLPLPGGRFALVSLAQSQVMEPALAAQFPEIRTFVFEDEMAGITGHMAVGPDTIRIGAQLADGILYVETVPMSAGPIYVSYMNHHRTDGLDDLVEPGDRHEHDDPPPVPKKFNALGNLTSKLSAGTHLRRYRLAAATTAEFYQARGGSDANVLFSLVADLVGANAIFEPEVSVRLILAAATLDVLYDDPNTQPFDESRSACELRDDNRDNAKAVLNDADYDLSFLFSTKPGGGANGCAWFVVCLTTNDTLHKARGAGKMGNSGMNSASGLLAHEVGHILGARHTFTGLDGSCTLNEFLAGNSESGYEPGSGTTRMSYRGNCGTDNVDTDAVGAGSYFHSRSFDEIVGNVFFGDGATCGTLVATSNQPPVVFAGPDYTIPRQTPFTLSGIAFDSEELTYNWEQYDRAVFQRPIDTDLGDGPIIRSVPPGPDPSRTVPHMPDLLAGIQRKGEILPQINREMNFRLIARDNLMGAGGVAYDSMKVIVDGPPFFITAPDGGFLAAGCEADLTWEVGGGDVASHVSAWFSADGGSNFDVPLFSGVPNDGEDVFTVPCATGSEGRIKLQADGNIFFDVNDSDLTVFNNPPVVEVEAEGGSVDDMCEFTVEFSATATDNCGLDEQDISVELFKVMDNFTLGAPVVNTNQVSPTEVELTGSVLVSDLLSSPAELVIEVTALDHCGAETQESVLASIVDDTPPEIAVSVKPEVLWPPNHKLRRVEATVVATDNCPGVSFALTDATSNEPDNGLGDGDMPNDIQDADFGTPDLELLLRRERSGLGDGRIYTITYTATDGSDNETEDSATVEVPLAQD